MTGTLTFNSNKTKLMSIINLKPNLLSNLSNKALCTLVRKKMSFLMRKTGHLHMRKTKAQISFAVTVKLISAFVFATWIVQFLYFLNPKFPTSSLLLTACTARFVSNKFRNHTIGFLMTRLLPPLLDLVPSLTWRQTVGSSLYTLGIHL